jgi:hypothetical protein
VSAWWTGLAPAQATLECGGATHRLRWADGELHALDHDDIEGERALAALGDERCACVDALDGWHRHANDLRVLVLGPRGASDSLAPEGRHPAGVHSYAGSGGPQSRPSEPEDALLGLYALGGGLRERLAATVVAGRLDGFDAAERARLHAALAGRAMLALRAWLGEPGLRVELRMNDAPSVARDGGLIELTLPLSWLIDVWAKGLAVIWGRFCLAASTEDGHRFTLTTVGPDLGEPELIRLELGGEPSDVGAARG